MTRPGAVVAMTGAGGEVVGSVGRSCGITCPDIARENCNEERQCTTLQLAQCTF